MEFKNESQNKKRFVIAISVAVLLVGVTAYAAVTVILVVGIIPESALFDGPATVTVRTLTIAPGESLAWHYHPGYAYNVVKSGTLTVEDGCGGEETLTPGQAFEEMDGRVHRAKNLSTTEDVVVYNTFIVPEGKPTTTFSCHKRSEVTGPTACSVAAVANLHVANAIAGGNQDQDGH